MSRYAHDFASVPIGWGQPAPEPIAVRKQGSYALLTDEMLADTFARFLSFGWWAQPQTWREREAELVRSRALRRRIPRALRAARHRAAHAIAHRIDGGCMAETWD